MENKKLWKTELYQIQLGAPKPKKIACVQPEVQRPEWYGDEYHGVLAHKEAAALLRMEPNGAYLVRRGNSDNDFYTLTWRFNNSIHHYKLHYDGSHFLRPSDKRYESVAALVADGLVTRHMEVHASHMLEALQSEKVAKAYTDSPYVTLNRRKLKSLSRTQMNQSHELTEKPSTDGHSVTMRSTNQHGDRMPTTDHHGDTIHSTDLHSDMIHSTNQQCDTIRNTDRHGDTMRSTDPLLATDDGIDMLAAYSKPHAFKTNTFKGLNWCELCANFLWGFTAQGVKCEDCGFIAHSKCSERVPSHCVPDLKKLRGVFGIDLTTLLTGPTVATKASTLPFVVRACVREIEQRGMDSEGIYRISGFADEIEALKMAFDRDGEAADLSVFSNINVVAGTLKLYLRLLPVPLITHDAHPHLVSATNGASPEQQASLMRDCLARLPPAHYNCLQYVIQHLHRVSLREEVNKMSAHNLSTVLAPTLVATPPAATDLTFEIRALQALIELSPHIYYARV